MSTIYTFGYAGHTITEFCSLLKSHQIDLIIDVRKLPLDKAYPDFDKFSLIYTLQTECAITTYLHIKALGCSAEIARLQQQELGYLKYFQRYERYLQNKQDLIANLAEEISNLNVCLLCAETDPQTCHRTLIADYLQIQNYDSAICHLT